MLTFQYLHKILMYFYYVFLCTSIYLKMVIYTPKRVAGYKLMYRF